MSYINKYSIMSIIFGLGSATMSGFILHNNKNNIKKKEFVIGNSFLLAIYLIALGTHLFTGGYPFESDNHKKFNISLVILLFVVLGMFGGAIKGYNDLKTPATTTTGIVNPQPTN